MEGLGMIMLVIPVLAIAVVVAVMAGAVKSGRKPHALETGKTPLYKEEGCGARIGRMNCTMPFARIALYDEFLVIACPWTKIVLRYEEIVSAEIRRVIFSKGVVIAHRNPRAPERLIVWSGAPDKLLEALATHIGPR